MIGTSDVAHATGYMNQRTLAYTQDGTLWSMAIDTNGAVFNFSTNDGEDWVESDSDIAGVLNGSLVIKSDDTAVLAYRKSTGLYYRTGTLSDHVWTWGTEKLVHADYNYPALAVEGTLSVIAASTDTDTAYFIYNNGSQTASGSLSGNPASLPTYPCVDIVSGTAHFAWDSRSTADGTRYRTYASGSLTAVQKLSDRTIATEDGNWFTSFHDGTRFYTVGYYSYDSTVQDDGVDVAVELENVVVTVTYGGTTTEFTGRYRIKNGSAGYDQHGSVYIVGYGFAGKVPDYEIVDEAILDPDTGQPMNDPVTGAPLTQKVVNYEDPEGDPALLYKVWNFKTGRFAEGESIEDNSDTNHYPSVRRNPVNNGDGRRSIDVVYTDNVIGPYDLEFARVKELNSAPTATLTGAAVVDNSGDVVRTWTFTDPDAGDGQTKFNYRYKVSGDSTWRYTSGVTISTSTDITLSNVPTGDIIEEVKVYDNDNEASAWIQGSFTTAAPTSAPSITAPTSNSTVAASAVTLEWTASDQTAYQIVTTDGYDSGVVAGAAVSASVPLTDNGEYVTLKVRVKGASGLWSAYTERRIYANRDLPAAPSMSVSADDGFVVVNATTPDSGATLVQDTYIYRREVNGTSIRIAKGLGSNPRYEDYAVKSGTNYEYKVVAVGVNGAKAEGSWS